MMRSASACALLSIFAALGAGAEESSLPTLFASEGDFNAGVAAHRRGDLTAAGRAYAAAVAKDDGYVEAIVNLARVRIEESDFESAELWLERAERARSDYPAIPAVRGLLALRRGNAALAIDELSRSRSLAPNDVEVLINLGAALLAQGFWKDASRVLDEAGRLDPHRPELAFNLGLANDLGGDTTRAAYYYRRFLETAAGADPDRPSVEKRLAQVAGQTKGEAE